MRWSRVIGGAVAGVAMILTALAISPRAPIGDAHAAETRFGFNEGWTGFGDQLGLAVRKSTRAGADSNRINVAWRHAEPEPGVWRWSDYDRIYRKMRRQGQRPILTLWSAPCWANPATPCGAGESPVPPDRAHLDAWASFVAEAVRRYPQVAAVQIWNEPNHSNFWADPNADHYVAVLEVASRTLKEVAPQLPVVVGAPSPARMRDGIRWRPFLRQVYGLGGGRLSDGLGLHIYPRARALQRPGRKVARTVVRQIRTGRRIVRQSTGAPAPPVWVTEIGIGTDSRREVGVGYRRQARLLAKASSALRRRPGVEAVVVHRLVDDNSASRFLRGLGVMRTLSDPKPAFRLLRSLHR